MVFSLFEIAVKVRHSALCDTLLLTPSVEMELKDVGLSLAMPFLILTIYPKLYF